MSYDETNPATSSLLVSGDMRANFVAGRRNLPPNLLQDPCFEVWPDTDSVCPSTWRLSGTGATIARQTSAANIAVGPMSAQVTYGSAAAVLAQYLLDSTGYDSFFDGRVFTAGCHVKCSTASIARVRVSDGATTTDSSYHTGGGSFEFLSVEHQVDLAATELEIQLRVENTGSAIFSGAVALFSDIKPDRFQLPIVHRGTLIHSRRGEIFTGLVDSYSPQRAFIIDHVQLNMTTAPTGAAAIADVRQWDGSAYTSMFSTLPQIAAAASPATGGAAPDGTYNRRCFNGYFGSASLAAGEGLQTQITQVGSTVIGNDMNIYMRYRAFLRPQELLADYAMIN